MVGLKAIAIKALIESIVSKVKRKHISNTTRKTQQKKIQLKKNYKILMIFCCCSNLYKTYLQKKIIRITNYNNQKCKGKK